MPSTAYLMLKSAGGEAAGASRSTHSAFCSARLCVRSNFLTASFEGVTSGLSIHRVILCEATRTGAAAALGCADLGARGYSPASAGPGDGGGITDT